MNKKLKLLALSCIFGLTSVPTYAALSSTAILNFDSPVYDPNTGYVISGSNFAVDFTGDGIIELAERTGLLANDGLILGEVQSGSVENPGIDQPWSFFANPGIHKTTSPVTILNDDGYGNVQLDFSGWTVNWNGIDIALGGTSWGSNPDGVAMMSCGSNCSVGDSFSLFYTATVTEGPFIGIRYRLGFDSYAGNPGPIIQALGEGGPVEDSGLIATGTIGASVVPLPPAVWLFGSGLIALIGIAKRKKA